MNIQEKIYKLMSSRGWTTYGLADKAGMTQSTISSLFRFNAVPKIPTIEKICRAFGISLSEFFSEDKNESAEQELLHKFNNLSESRKILAKAIIDEFQDK